MGVYLKKMNAKSSIKKIFSICFCFEPKRKDYSFQLMALVVQQRQTIRKCTYLAPWGVCLFFFPNSTPAALWIRRMLLYNMTEFADVIRSRPIISVRVESYLFRRRQLFLKEKLCNLIAEWREFNAKRQENFGEIERFYKRNVLKVSRN